MLDGDPRAPGGAGAGREGVSEVCDHCDMVARGCSEVYVVVNSRGNVEVHLYLLRQRNTLVTGMV